MIARFFSSLEATRRELLATHASLSSPQAARAGKAKETAGVDVGGGGKGGRKTVDSEINMIPMIDLLMVTISFLLITAVWTHMARINADAQVPGPPTQTEPTDLPNDKTLDIDMRDPAKFTMIWKQGAVVLTSFDVPRNDQPVDTGHGVVRYPELAEKIASEWKTNGAHHEASDRKFDQAILHTSNETPYRYLIAVMDALYQPHRGMTVGQKTEQVPAFNVTFAVN